MISGAPKRFWRRRSRWAKARGRTGERGRRRAIALGQSVLQTGQKFAESKAFLLHGITVAKGDGIFLSGEGAVFDAFESFKINGEAEGGAHLILATVSATNGPGFVIKNGKVRAKGCGQGASFGDQFGFIFQKRKDAHFDGSHLWVKAENDASFFRPFFVGDFFFRVSLTKKGKSGAIHAGTGLDNMGDKFFSGLFVEILEGLAAGGLVLFEVVIRPVSDALKFLRTEGESVEEVIGALGVKGTIVFRHVENGDLAAGEANGLIPSKAVGQPLIEPLFPFGRANKKLYFHLFKLAGAEGEIAGVNFVAKGFTDLGDTEREFFAGNFKNVFKLNKHGLGGFGTEIGEVAFVFDGTDVGFEHEIELARFGHFPTAGRDVFTGFLRARGMGDLIGAKAPLASFAIDHGIGESSFVAAGFPNGAAHEDGAVHAHNIVPMLGHTFPPVVFEIAFEGDAEGAVIPSPIEAPIDFGGRENEPSAFAKGDNLFHAVIRHRIIFWF